jgi:predicted acylesterase/phospholipase RssA
MIRNIAFSGGALKGHSFIGVLQYLEDKNILHNIENFSGTSIGSFFCLLVILGYSSTELKKLVYNLDIDLLEDVNINLLFTYYGLDTGKRIKQLIKYLIKLKGYDENISFKDLYDKTKKTLNITTTKLSNYTQYIFNHENTPDHEVYKACNYSMSIPLLWVSENVGGEYYIDGCFVRNLPIEILPVENTVGFSLYNKEKGNKKENIENIKDFIIKVTKCSFSKGNSLELDNYKMKGYKIIIIDVCNISALDLDLSSDSKKLLIDSGYRACDNLKLI